MPETKNARCCSSVVLRSLSSGFARQKASRRLGSAYHGQFLVRPIFKAPPDAEVNENAEHHSHGWPRAIVRLLLSMGQALLDEAFRGCSGSTMGSPTLRRIR